MFRLLVFLVLYPFLVSAQWEEMAIPSKASFRSLSVPTSRVIWAGGSGNTILKSINGGEAWESFSVFPEQKLDFTGIYAFDHQNALAVSAGLAEEGSAVIVRTSDGGTHWEKVFETNQIGVFLDGIHFINKKVGFVIGDPQDGKVYMLKTIDGGYSWSKVSASQFPEVYKTEASFAASNSSLSSYKKNIWYAFQSRILFSSNAGKTWMLLDSHFPSDDTNGIFGLNFRSKTEGILLGGDYVNDKASQVNVGLTHNGGQTWEFMSVIPDGLKESAVWVDHKWLIVGTTGSGFLTPDGNMTTLGTKALHVVKCNSGMCYAIGPKGHFVRMALK